MKSVCPGKGTVVALGLVLAVVFTARAMPQEGIPGLTIDPDDIGGVVRGAQGPEAGVWVIAETSELPTPFIRIVVTDDEGRFVLPDLPKATYRVWVRGYGLADSAPIQASGGSQLTLTARPAATTREAAQIYPGNYWYSLIQPPPPGEFPGTGPSGNGISPALQTQQQFVDVMKQGCQVCHQLGTRATREIANLSNFDSTEAAWDHRVQSGQRGSQMSNTMSRFGRQSAVRMFADWTDRIAQGEVPPAPPRPQGLERNVVLTLWDWSTPYELVHDEVASDKRNPRVNANGPIYGVAISNDLLTVLDPATHRATNLKVPLRNPAGIEPMYPASVMQPSPYWGDEQIWNNPANPHNPMMDDQGRVWMTSQIRAPENPAWCREGSENAFARYFPLSQSGRQVAVYDPKNARFSLIDTCFGTHHLQFAEDEDDTLWFSGGGQVVGWLNTHLHDEKMDEQGAQGWCPTVVDTNGDGKITKPWNEPVGGGRSTEEGAGGGVVTKFDPSLDTRVNVGSYGIVADPLDTKAVWFASTSFPGRIVRLHVGDDPPETCLTEVYEVPSLLDPRVPKEKTGFGPRGIDITREGVVWTALSGSSHLASFDRRKCGTFRGPDVFDGRHCVDGWTLYPTPGPTLQNTDPPVRADFHYYNWVDQFNTLGLGENVPIANGSTSEALLALLPDTGEWVVLRVPYPLGFYTKGLDGRIDDPSAGWKGRGVWATSGTGAPWHIEGGKGTKPKVARFQVRPNPLAH